MEFRPEPVDVARARRRGARHRCAASPRRSELRSRSAIDAGLASSLSSIRRGSSRSSTTTSRTPSSSRPTGGRVTVRVAADGPRARFRIEVEDTGIGIRAEDLPQLFVEFQQLDAGRAPSSTRAPGLGLALTKRIVEAQGGRVGVTQHARRGQRRSSPSCRVPRADRRGRWRGAREPILIVDDNPQNLKLARVLLEARRLRRRTARRTPRRRWRCSRRCARADSHGPSAARHGRPRAHAAAEGRSRAHGAVAIVALTAYAMKGDEEKARAAGCDGYVTKPIDTRALAALVGRAAAGDGSP